VEGLERGGEDAGEEAFAVEPGAAGGGGGKRFQGLKAHILNVLHDEFELGERILGEGDGGGFEEVGRAAEDGDETVGEGAERLREERAGGLELGQEGIGLVVGERVDGPPDGAGEVGVGGLREVGRGETGGGEGEEPVGGGEMAELIELQEGLGEIVEEEEGAGRGAGGGGGEGVEAEALEEEGGAVGGVGGVWGANWTARGPASWARTWWREVALVQSRR